MKFIDIHSEEKFLGSGVTQGWRAELRENKVQTSFSADL
jgi:hypothetical protein